MNVRTWLLGFALIGFSSAAVALPAHCTPVIGKAWIRAAPPGAKMLAGYATVRNPCAKAMQVTGVSSRDFATAMMHETVLLNGMSTMRHTATVTIPAGGEVVFAPSGRHIMLMGPARVFRVGDKVGITFVLSDGKKLEADFMVLRDPPH